MNKPNFFILTGGPGAGKSSVLEALAKRGFVTVPEVARSIIQEQQNTGGNALHTGDRNAFLERMLRASVADYKSMHGSNRIVFFDRGLPDLYGYAAEFCNKPSQAINHAVKAFRYNQKVFLFPPWEAIYTNDTERQQDFAEAQQTCIALKNGYLACGYRLVEVPRVSVEARTDFILTTIRTI